MHKLKIIMSTRLVAKGLGLASILLPLAALAQGTLPGGSSATQLTNPCRVLELVRQITSWFGILVFIIAIIAILYAGFLFLTAGGNEETLKKARQVLIWGLIGIAVALFAMSAIPFVVSIIGGTSFSQCQVGL
mgnify:CR=1 FL=1